MKTILRSFIGGTSLWTLASCMGEPGTAPRLADASETLGSVQAFPSVVIIARGDTTRLHMMVRSLTGDTALSLDSVAYVPAFISDTMTVQVSPSGLLSARDITPSVVRINVFAYKGKAVKADQVQVLVTETGIPDLALSIQPTELDSTRLAIGARKRINATLRNSAGESVSSPPIRYRVHPQFNSMVSVYQPRLTVPGGTIDAQVQGEPRVNANEIIPKVGEGSVWIHADVFAYGVRLRDSVQYTFSYAYAASFDIRTNQIRLGLENAANRTVYLAPGGTLSITNSYADSVGVSITATFSGPSTPAEAIPASSSGGSAGDITPITGGQSSRRRFLTPGRYTWTIKAESSTGLFNNTASGTIFVK